MAKNQAWRRLSFGNVQINVIISENLYDRHFVATWCLGFEELKERIKEYSLRRLPQYLATAEEIVKASRIFAATKPASCHRRLGVAAQHINATQAGRAMAILTAITESDIPEVTFADQNRFKDMKVSKGVQCALRSENDKAGRDRISVRFQ